MSGEAVLRPGASLPELTSARGFAASAVVLYHLDGYSRGFIGQAIPTGVFGGLAVDFFFILSGFVLAHVYGAAWAEGRYAHRDFLLRRVARIWPLHMACLLGVAAIVLAGRFVGISPPWSPTLESFFGHAALMNAVGLFDDRGWNQPAWSVGAEWTAYLAFPLYLAAASALRTRGAKFAAAIIVMGAFWLGLRVATGEDLMELDRTGALRIVPSFFAGVVLRQIFETGRGFSVSQARVTRIAIEAVIVIALAAWAGAPKVLLWPGLMLLVYALALKGRAREGGVLRAKPLIWFGEVSYALYLVHAPVLMLTFGLGGKLLGVEHPWGLVALGIAGAAASLAAASLAHHLLERPAQRAILKAATPRRLSEARGA